MLSDLVPVKIEKNSSDSKEHRQRNDDPVHSGIRIESQRIERSRCDEEWQQAAKTSHGKIKAFVRSRLSSHDESEDDASPQHLSSLDNAQHDLSITLDCASNYKVRTIKLDYRQEYLEVLS